MIHELRVLLRWALILSLAVAFIVVVLSRFALVLDPVIPVSIALALATIVWLASAPTDRDDTLGTPSLQTDVTDTPPHGDDLAVRRLEDMIDGAQPHRRMTGRALGQVLGDIADDREHREGAAPLSAPLARLIRDARSTDPDAPEIGAIDQRTLHRYLRELSAPPQEDR